MARIDINIAAEDPVEGDFVGRLVTAALTTNDFDDVTSSVHSAHQETEEDVVAAMRNLNPVIFSAEITVGVTPFEEALIDADAPAGDTEFPSPESEDSEDPDD